MATVDKTDTILQTVFGRAYKTVWALGDADAGDPTPKAISSDRSVQVEGTFAGASVVIEGSNDGGTNYHTLTDPLGNALTFTVAGLKQVMEVVQLLRPRSSGGSGAALVVSLVSKGGRG